MFRRSARLSGPQFFPELRQRFPAPGDFAQAYVIAHEVGHHVQSLLGIAERVRVTQHGSSAQRVRWFRRGLESGGMKTCDTFGADTP